MNAATYWLVAALAAIPIFFTVQMAAQAISQTLSAADEADWITGRPPRGLQLDAVAFQDLRKSLIETLRYTTDPQSTSHFLVPADENQLKGACGEMSFSFGIPESHVYPNCVTFAIPPTTKAAALTNAERAVFQRFAEFITQKFKQTAPRNPDRDHPERQLARALGLSDALTNGKPLDVPWIYVASRDGPIAVFPGTDVIAGSFDPKTRPWYMAAFLGMKQLWCDVPDRNDRLSVTYLDVGAANSILVRSYLSTFQHDGQDFVIGIDLTRRGESLGSYAGPLDSPWTQIPLARRWCVALLLSLTLFAILKGLSEKQERRFFFDCRHSLYGIVDPKDGLQRSDTSKDSTNQSWLAAFSGQLWGLKFGGKSEHSSEQTSMDSTSRTAEVSRSRKRGIEVWSVAHNNRAYWDLFGLRFASIAHYNLGTIQVTYTNAILPDVEWTTFDSRRFPDDLAPEIKARLARILRKNADSTDNGQVRVPESSSETVSLELPQVPVFVAQTVRNAQELLAVRQRRAYVSLTDSRLSELYDKADEVRAVVLHTYFERVLEEGRTEFLLKGRAVDRLISFPNAQTHLLLSEMGRKNYARLLEAFNATSRNLRRLDSPIEIEGPLTPVYDFALMRDQGGERVFVVHTVSETRVIDIASPSRRAHGFRVDGYLSWRRSDVSFYSQLFDQLAAKSTEMLIESDSLRAVEASGR